MTSAPRRLAAGPDPAAASEVPTSEGRVIWTRSAEPEPPLVVGSQDEARHLTSGAAADITGASTEEPADQPTTVAQEEELARTGGQTYTADGTEPAALWPLQPASGSIDFAACEANPLGSAKEGVVLDHFNSAGMGSTP
ncbi:hypothetical protein [Streptomyces sp. SAS_270]|uniref:hypothetical protein n=1 Tax=Streptomyces sp. SAS_270 TaxID=3412748 RepID=UPI00403C7F98